MTANTGLWVIHVVYIKIFFAVVSDLKAEKLRQVFPVSFSHSQTRYGHYLLDLR